MRKSFMNIKHFVDSNVRHRIDKTTTNSGDFIGDDLALVERQFEDLRQLCVEAEKRISTMLQSLGPSTLGAYTQNVQASLNNLSQLTATSPVQQMSSSANEQYHSLKNYINQSSLNNTSTQASGSSSSTGATCQLQVDGGQTADSAELDIRKHHKKLPIVGFLKFLVKSSHKLRQDSLLASTLTHCSHLQAQLTKLYLYYERTIEAQCLKPIQHVLEIDVPSVIRLRKSFIKAHNDLEAVRTRYNGASQKQQQFQTVHFSSSSYTITQSNAQQANINKLDQLKKELEDAETRFEQAKDTYAIELYTFVCREIELVDFFMKFYQHQAEYQRQVSVTIQNSLPTLRNTLATTPRKAVFGTPLEEHLRCTGRSISVLIELSVHLLYSNALNEEGLFRIPGSSIKIKKLKSAINAWFVTLANHNELLNNQARESTQKQNKVKSAQQQPTLLAIYSLFKDIVGQRPPNQQTTAMASGESNLNNQIAPSRDELAQTAHSESSTTDRDAAKQQQLVFDVHTVAGLLKLYLRELPEPLLGYALYDQWVSACVKGSSTGEQEQQQQQQQISALKCVVEQLPQANYDNLRLLIRFLHLLTCHHERNKMTATNLAITMAPSMIWSPKSCQQHDSSLFASSDSVNQMEDANALNIQMSTMGISASLHALVVENLISNAEQLFPGELEFSLPYLDDESDTLQAPISRRAPIMARARPVKSTSPTGSSTGSTSSFSSASNMSSGKKSGSIDGLAVSDNVSPVPSRSPRPISVHLNRFESDKKPARPPVPPAPVIRSHSRQASDSATSIRSASHKAPAPPIPPPCTLRRQHAKTTDDNQPTESLATSVASLINASEKCETDTDCATQRVVVQPISLRGTGTTSTIAASGHGTARSTRPSVPPPARPHDSLQAEARCNQTEIESLAKGVSFSSKGAKSTTETGSFHNEFEEITVSDVVDGIDGSDQTSPVLSLDSTSGDDSSFDNHSLDHSWTECDSDKARQIDSSGEEVIAVDGKTNVDHPLAIKPTPRGLTQKRLRHLAAADGSAARAELQQEASTTGSSMQQNDQVASTKAKSCPEDGQTTGGGASSCKQSTPL